MAPKSIPAAPAQAFLTVLLLLVSAGGAIAQTVRGTVSERGTNVPLAGALVTLDREGSASFDAPLRRTATNQQGAYAVRAPSPGRFQLTVRRIGAKLHTQVVTLTGVDVLEINVQLEAFTSLPVVAVRDSSLCVTRNADNVRVAQLWEAARTSLSVVAISGDTIVGARLVRYERQRNPDTFEITEEELHSYDARDGISEPVFRSRGGSELSKSGYWQGSGLTTEFFAPDAEALLSTAFLLDHCFGLREGDPDRPALVGLTFTPVRGRRVPEISGTLWLDARTYELQRLEFEWLGLPPSMQHDHVGATVEFMRLPTGAVIVKRWSLVMPQTGPPEGSGVRSSFGNASSLKLIEEGGVIVHYGLNPSEVPGVVSGRVLRPNGGPMRWARVKLVGLPHEAVVDSSGTFTFARVPPGPHSIVVEHGEFDAFGVRVAEQEFLLDDGAIRTLVFRASSERELIARVCAGASPRAASLRVVLLDEVTLQPRPHTRLRLHWLERVNITTTGRHNRYQMTDMTRDSQTDASGAAQFCAVAPSFDLTLSQVDESGSLKTLRTLKLNPGQNEVVRLKLARVPAPEADSHFHSQSVAGRR
jgi:hypothetical protein